MIWKINYVDKICLNYPVLGSNTEFWSTPITAGVTSAVDLRKYIHINNNKYKKKQNLWSYILKIKNKYTCLILYEIKMGFSGVIWKWYDFSFFNEVNNIDTQTNKVYKIFC